MNWKKLEKIEQLEEIDRLSAEGTVLIFKHSTRCSISIAALGRLERHHESLKTIADYYLDLLSHRDISNAIAERYQVIHESPQAILIKNGKAVHVRSHFEINWEDLQKMTLVN